MSKHRLRILYVVDSYPPYNAGGDSISTSIVVKEVSKHHDCYVLTQRPPKSPWDYQGIKSLPILISYSPNFSSVFKLMKNSLTNSIQFINFLKIKKFVKKNKIDLIHTTSNSMALVRRLIDLDVPLVFDVRDSSFKCPIMSRGDDCNTVKSCDSYTHLKKYFSKKYSSNKKLLFLLPILLRIFLFDWRIQKKRLVKKTKRATSIKIVSLSKYIQRTLISEGFDSGDTLTIYNPSQNSLKSENRLRKNKIVFAGIVESPKGIWDAIYAFEYLNDKNLTFEIVGEGPEMENIQNYLLEKKVKNIRLLGKLPNKSVLELYSTSKIILGPSRIAEGFGRFIQEGIATRTPVIATNMGGIPEGIKNYETGLLVEPNNPKQLAKAIKELLTDKELYSRIVKNLEKEADKYNHKKIGNQRAILYDRLIKNYEEQKNKN